MLKNRLIINILIIIVTVLMASASYFTYISYQKYTTTLKGSKVALFLDEIKSLSQNIESERTKGISYKATKRDDDSIELQDSRNVSDQSLEKIKNFIQTDIVFTSYAKNIGNIETSLKLIREDIDTPYLPNSNIFYSPNNTTHSELFSEIIYYLSATQKSKLIQKYLSAYIEYVKLRESSQVENRAISLALLVSKKIKRADIVEWKKLIDNDILPEINIQDDSKTKTELQSLLTAGEYKDLLLEERSMIFGERDSGLYSVSPAVWSNKIDTKMDYIDQVQSLLREKISLVEQAHIFTTKKEALIYGGGTLMLMLILIWLIISHRGLQKEHKISEETLKDIELVFNKDQQNEIKRLIDSGKVDHIYKFLIKAIKDANHTKDLFLANMSHEVRTPLNGIVGFTHLLKESSDKEEQMEFISVIEKSSNNLLSIVNDILDLSKIKAEKIDIEMIEFDPISSFEAAVESYSVKAAEKDIDFNIFLDPRLPDILIGDPTKLSQIIVNLVSNATKFTPKNGEVNVNIELFSEDSDSAQVKFEVTDTGIGITPEQKKSIFEAFSQADVSTTRKYGGTGLGLSISGKFVDLMGGKLSIWSAKDQGSSFYFNISLKKSKNSKKRVVENMSSTTVGILSSHIDDEYSINKNLEAYIAYTGAKIVRYTNETLLELKGTSRVPDILFIDNKFRYRGEEIRQFLDFDTKTIVMSTPDQKRNLNRYITNIDKILYKPVNFTKTLNALSSKEDDSLKEEKVIYNNVRILVADDNTINQRLILNILERVGVEVTIASNGQDALIYRQENDYDMIFMDIQMPVMGGMEATANILSHERRYQKRHIPIFALTANAVSGDRDRYLGAGMDGYLSKPIELDKLYQILQEHFSDRASKL